MAKQAKKQVAPANAMQAMAATVVAAPVAVQPAPPTVALRGGPAVATVAIAPGTVYRTKAPHNVAWWAAITKACASGPAPVTTLLAQAPAGAAVPSHFVTYCMRRGYLVGA